MGLQAACWKMASIGTDRLFAGRSLKKQVAGPDGEREKRGALGKVEMLKAEMKTAPQKPGDGKIGRSSDRFN